MENSPAQGAASTNNTRNSALKFIVLLGIVSLFADMTYEGARSITGPYLKVLGASATVVGIVAGFGEFIGYGFRLVSGYVSDRTGRYWALTILGYVVNLMSVPLLAFAGYWEFAACLIITERIGKAIRVPARDTMLSLATKEVGRGWGFGLHEALDQIGAVAGPLAVALGLYYNEGFKTGFLVLFVPAIFAIAFLLTARSLYPNPRAFETAPRRIETKGLKGVFWVYLAAISLIAAGYADFPLIAYHFKAAGMVSDTAIPLMFAFAMGTDAVAALVFGRLFDRFGITVLAAASLLSAIAPPLLFLGGFGSALAGMALWGVGMGAQESIMRAAVAQMAPVEKRGSAYGVFNTGYGLFWFIGSSVMGMLYDVSAVYLVIFSVALQLASIPVLILAKRRLG